MDYNQEAFMRMQQYAAYMPRMPFYMAYPMQNVYMTEMEYERDMERMKELYPKNAKDIQKLVEEECDKLEYEGSMMFDEYPDRTMLRVICDRVYQQMIDKNAANKMQQDSTRQSREAGRDMDALPRSGRNTDEQFRDAGKNTDAVTQDEMREGILRQNALCQEATGTMTEGYEMQNIESEQYRRPDRPGRPNRPGGPPPRPNRPGGPPPRPNRPPRDQGLENLIEVLLYNEMYKRRCRHNRCRRWW